MLLTNHAFGRSARWGAARPRRSRASTASSRAWPARAARVDRSDRIFASPRLVRVHRDGVLAAARAHARGGAPGAAAGPGRALPCPFPWRCARLPRTTRFLSTAHGRDSGFVAVHMFEGMAWRPYFRAVEAVMDELGGRPHWGKRHFQTAATLRERYPQWDRFQAVRGRLDPQGRFANAWTDRNTRTRPPPTHHPPLAHQPERPPAAVDVGVDGGSARWRGTEAPRHRPRWRHPLTRTIPKNRHHGWSRPTIFGATSGPLLSLSRPSRWWTSTPSGPTPRIWNGAPRPSRSAWPASRCAAARCRNACSCARALPARWPSRCPRRCGWPSRACATSLWRIRQRRPRGAARARAL